jgi:hypothetical protein
LLNVLGSIIVSVGVLVPKRAFPQLQGVSHF